jgi:drug/metabolite transporter (DMT)-like permease
MNALNTDTDSRPLAGALWMLASGLCFVGVTATVKAVAGGIPAAQSAFLRFALGLVFVLPVLRLLIRDWPGPHDLGLFALRGALHTGAVICWFYAMTRIPLAEVTAMGYLTPVFTALGAAAVLGERLRMRRIAAIVAAVAGALVVLRPGLREISDGHLAMVGTTLCFAVSYLVAKPLTGRHSAAVVVAMLSITVTVGLAPLAALVWVPVTLTQTAGLFAVACFATAGHFAMTKAFAAAPITVTQPVTALQLVWSVLIGATFFAESVDIYVVAGGAVIVSAVIFIALREAQLARAARPDRAGVDKLA